MVLTHLGWVVWEATYVKEFIALMQRTSNVFLLKMMLSTADLWAKNDISYGGHFCRMENPMTVNSLSERGYVIFAYFFLAVFLVYVFH